jgi:hypothetical protein
MCRRGIVDSFRVLARQSRPIRFENNVVKHQILAAPDVDRSAGLFHVRADSYVDQAQRPDEIERF